MIFVNPAQEKFGGPLLSGYVPVSMPTAIGTISAYLEKHGISSVIIDDEIDKITQSILYEIVEGQEKPYIFGLTGMTAHAVRTYEIAQMIKETFENSIVIAGGVHATAVPEEPLKTGFIDYVVRGEGEEIMLQLYRAIRGGSNPSNILGLSYKENGEIISNQPASLIPDLNILPIFPYHKFTNPKYDSSFIVSSRGCPYRCSYCSQRLSTGTTYRFRSAELVVEELDILVNTYSNREIGFYDDNFCLVNKRVHELCDLIIDRKLNEKVKLGIQTRADNFLSGGEDLIRHMAEAGFSDIGFGLETGTQRLADLIRKDETIETQLEATRLAQKHGFEVALFMIFGLPTETGDDRLEGFRIVNDVFKIRETKYNNLIPYPGTPMFSELKDSGRVVVTQHWGNFNSTLAMTRSIIDKTPLPYVPETSSEWELKRDIIRYNYRSYLHWRALVRIIMNKKGAAWFVLPERWYLKPFELIKLFKLGLHALANICLASLPLKITEPLMCALNPELKKRPRIKDYNPETYITKDWDKDETKNIMRRLKKAKDDYKSSGKVTVTNESGLNE